MTTALDRLLGKRISAEWVRLSARVFGARLGRNCCVANGDLATAAEREPEAPVAPAFALWVADNFAHDGHYAAAAKAYDTAVDRAQVQRDLATVLDPTVGALFSKAQALALTDDVSSAIDAFRDLRPYPAKAAAAFFLGGGLAERAGDHQQAADLYSAFARETPSAHTDDPAEQSRRALARMRDAGARYFATPHALMDALTAALERGDCRRLEGLVSRTHFTIGALGGHTAYEDLQLIHELCRDLGSSTVTAKRALLGSNAKLYLPTAGWNGRWFRGDVPFLLSRAPQGWQWTGVALSAPNERWRERWSPSRKETNSPLPFGLLAPWPEDQHFMAGGIIQFIGQQATVLGAGLFGLALAGAFASDECGWGPRGYYYNFDTTHTGGEAFAIDFTRYRRWVPYENLSGGTPVLAVRDGIVGEVEKLIPSGDDRAPNKVEIQHGDPANLSDRDRFTSRYLHLEGPGKVSVSKGMHVVAGNRLGLMDDTGNSVMDHLHFSIHDRLIPHARWPALGASVRPTPMEGMRLEDGDGGTCIRSTNREVRPLREVNDYAVQNWLITPSAWAVSETPGGIRDQRFLLALSGVAIVDSQGLSGAQWAKETISLRPPLWDALSYAVGKWRVPAPPGDYSLAFETEQWAPVVTLSSVWNQDESVNSGFAVDAWRLNPWSSGADAVTNERFDQLFGGIQVDLAVRDSDAWILRIGYSIVLLGRIVFIPFLVT